MVYYYYTTTTATITSTITTNTLQIPTTTTTTTANCMQHLFIFRLRSFYALLYNIQQINPLLYASPWPRPVTSVEVAAVRT